MKLSYIKYSLISVVSILCLALATYVLVSLSATPDKIIGSDSGSALSIVSGDLPLNDQNTLYASLSSIARVDVNPDNSIVRPGSYQKRFVGNSGNYTLDFMIQIPTIGRQYSINLINSDGTMGDAAINCITDQSAGYTCPETMSYSVSDGGN